MWGLELPGLDYITGNQMFETGGNFAERDPTNQNSEKSWEMLVNPDVDVYTKTLNHWKMQTNDLLKTKRKYRKVS